MATVYTFGDLQTELKQSLFPTGLPVNLVVPVRLMFVEAMLDLQKFVECLQINNVQVIPQCNTFFKCGYTVTDAPRGRITRVYTIDKINQETGLEDPTVALDWCSVVELRQANYDDLDRYVSTTLAGSLGEGFWPWLIGFGLQGVVAFPSTCLNWWYDKYAYPPPDDTPFAKSPPLPLGFHYPQSATDNPAGRSQWGLWALKGGQIYVAPWIQSTETLVIEWNGLKRDWQDSDLVDNDPMLKQAVEAYVSKEYARKYDRDYDAEASFAARFNEARAILMDECRRETEIRDSGEGAAARGAALIVPTFVNDAQTATAQCPTGTTGASVSYTVPQGFVVSTVSVADANARALSLALQTAGQQLTCTVTPPTFFNTPQSFTANCGTGTGSPVTVNIAAGQFSSIISQADADAQALAAATAAAESQIHCTFLNTQQQYTATCPQGTTGTPVTKTVAAGAYTSTISQSDADQKALTDATNQANAALTCNVPPTVFWNTEQTVTNNRVCFGRVGCTPKTFTESYTVPAHTISSIGSQGAANLAAINLGQNIVNSLLSADCANYAVTCSGGPGGGL